MIRSELVVRYPLGSSKRRKQRVILLAGIASALGSALLLFAGARASGRMTSCTYKSKIPETFLAVNEYANEAFPRWVANHPEQECPGGLADLNQYTNRAGANIADAWGNDLVMICEGGLAPLRVFSLGEDGRPNTADDIKSWE